VDWQTASVIDKFCEYLTVRRLSDTNPQQRPSIAALHRFDCISNQIHDDLLDLETIYEHHEDWFLVVALNWSGPAIYVLFDETYGISNEIHHIAGSLHDRLPLEQ
jgi:hypothetical protein